MKNKFVPQVNDESSGATESMTENDENSVIIVEELPHGYNNKFDSSSSSISTSKLRDCNSFEKLVQKVVYTQQLITEEQLKSCKEFIETDYNSIIDIYSPQDDQVYVHLHAASHIMKQFFHVTGIVNNFVKDRALSSQTLQSALGVIYSQVEDVIFSQLAEFTNNLSTISPTLASKLICWHENVLEEITAHYSDLDCVRPSSVWTSNVQLLLDGYLDQAVRYGMQERMKWIDKDYLQYTDDDIGYDAEEHVISNVPEEIIYVFDFEIQRAYDNIPEKYIAKVFETLYEAVSTMITDKLCQIDSDWRNIRPVVFCSVINDTNRLRKLLHERSEYYFSVFWTEDEDKTNLDRVRNKEREVQLQLEELEATTTEFLLEHLRYGELLFSESTLACIGANSWELDWTGSGMAHIAGIILRHIADTEKWLYNATSYLPQCIKNILDFTLQAYVESFYFNTMRYAIRDVQMVTKNLQHDYSIFVEMINSPLVTKYDCNQDISPKIRVVESLSRILNPNHRPSDLLDDIQTVLELISTSEDSAVAPTLHLAGLRGISNEWEAVEWIGAIATALQEIAETSFVKENPPSTFAAVIPDITSSPFIYKVRITMEIDDLFSGPRLFYAQATKEFIDDGFQKLLASYMERKQTIDFSKRQGRRRSLFFG